MARVRYCQLVEKKSHLVHFFWKGSHLLGYLLVAVVSLVAAIQLKMLRVIFGQRCILYPHLVFEAESAYDPVGAIPRNLSFHNPRTIWGDQAICFYVNGTFLFSHILAVILFLFTLILPKGGRADDAVFTQPWKLAPIALIISIIIAVCVWVADHYVQCGLGEFVTQLRDRLRLEGYCSVCEDLDGFTLIFNEKQRSITSRIKSLKSSSCIASLAWLFNVITLSLRMILGIDFNIIVFTLTESLKEDTKSVSSKGSYTIGEKLPRMLQYESERKATDILEHAQWKEEFDSDSSVEVKLK